jgi:hypothetical protein
MVREKNKYMKLARMNRKVSVPNVAENCRPERVVVSVLGVDGHPVINPVFHE